MPLDPARIRLLCFDVDGTLSDTDDLYVKQVLRFLPRFLFSDPEHAARRLVMWAEAPGNGLLGLADRFGLDDEMVAFIDWMHRHRRQKFRDFLLVPGVGEMLTRLSGIYPMAVISARPASSTLAFLDHFGLAGYFDVIVTALSASHTKPYPDPILLAARELRVRPDQCVMIGDTTVDIRAGRSAGAQTIGVLCGFGEEQELAHMGADLILERTPQLADLLLK